MAAKKELSVFPNNSIPERLFSCCVIVHGMLTGANAAKLDTLTRVPDLGCPMIEDDQLANDLTDLRRRVGRNPIECG